MHEEPAVTSDVPSDPFAMKTMPLSAEPRTWGSSAEKEGSPKLTPASGEGGEQGANAMLYLLKETDREKKKERRPEKGKTKVTQGCMYGDTEDPMFCFLLKQNADLGAA